MSRIVYANGDSPDWGLRQGRWFARVRAAMLGKRGQTVLRELAEALDAIPTQRLIHGALCNDNGDVCALGELARTRGIPDAELLKVAASLDEADDPAFETAAWAARALDVTETLAWMVQDINDEEVSETASPETRYRAVRDMVQRWLDDPEGTYLSYKRLHLP